VTWLRIFFIGGVIAYRGLFNWIRPYIYFPTMFGSPLFQLIFFTKLGQYAQAQDSAFYVVGNAVQVCSMASIGLAPRMPSSRTRPSIAPASA
jgi:hypothetical protein